MLFFEFLKLFMNMKKENNLTQSAAIYLAREFSNLIGESLPSPFVGMEISSITVEKDTRGKGFSVILSHDTFDGGWPELTGFVCPQVDLFSFLNLNSKNSQEPGS